MDKISVKEKYKVRPIESYLCKEWLLKKHYAKRLCSISYSFGLFEDEKMIGVCTFGMPPSSTLAKSICGDKYKNIVIELNRLCVNEGLDKNTLSYFVSSSIKLLPNPSIIVSFSDTNIGHNGYIYQACNFLFTGQSTNTTKLIDSNGNEFHFRNIGHYQKNNRLNVPLIKRRVDENNIDKIAIANYLRANKGDFKSRDLDKLFGYKDTCSHWFRTDDGFSFPNIDDWFRLKNILGFDDTYDEVMTKYELIADSNEIVKKLNLTKVEIKPKNRYIYLFANKVLKKTLINNLLLPILPYPKGENKRYDASYEPTIQTQLF